MDHRFAPWQSGNWQRICRSMFWAGQLLLGTTLAGQPGLRAADLVPVGNANSVDQNAIEVTAQSTPVLHLQATAQDGELILRGSDARQQLVATLVQAGEEADVTRSVLYTTAPEGVVSVSATGLVIPLQDGTTTLLATHSSSEQRQLTIRVQQMGESIPVNFPNEVVPVFTKYGCNGGGCHGKSGGQNGFRLSLLGFEPREDYEHLVLESRGRRLFPAAAERSLLLRKATGAAPHGGGAKLQVDTAAYHVLQRWIEQGMPYGEETDPKLVRVEVYPQSRVLPRGASQQLNVTAIYSDGTRADVTSMAQLEANQPSMAEINAGLVTARDETGDVAIMARYQGMVDVFRATIPLGAPVDSLPPVRNVLDELVFRKLKELGLPPSAVCDDETFLRRIRLDTTGALPTLAEREQFLADARTDKRERKIDELLASSEHADFFANKWSSLLRNRRQNEHYRPGTFALHAWVRDSVYSNKPFDRLVRELLTASGDMRSNPPVAWYRAVRQPNEQLEDVAQLFLGQRLQCARCHHHPFEKWSQQDYYGMAAFFSRVERKPALVPTEELIVTGSGPAVATHPKTGSQVPAAGLGAPPAVLKEGSDPREALVDWMVDPANPLFARSLANRYVKHYLGRGLVEPEDDLRLTNPASNPALLDALAQHLTDNHYDLRGLERLICNSSVYQLSSEPNAHNAGDKQNYARYYPRRLPAEVLYDAINRVTDAPSSFPGLPGHTRAVQLPDNGFGSYFLTVFGKPEGATACECERSGQANLAQCLHLLNSAEVQDKLAADAHRPSRLGSTEDRPAEARITELYLCALGRPPLPEELSIGEAHLKQAENPRRGFEDLTWALLNTKEFLFNH